MTELWPDQRNGWVIPEKLPNKAGRATKRAKRVQGFMLVMMHEDENDRGTNRVEYCLETKELKIFLGLAWFDMSLQFVDGISPPVEGKTKKKEFDIVDRTWVDRAAVAAWTEGRARDFFGEF